MATQSRLVGALATTFLFRGEVGNKMDQKMRMKAGVKKGRSRRHCLFGSVLFSESFLGFGHMLRKCSISPQFQHSISFLFHLLPLDSGITPSASSFSPSLPFPPAFLHAYCDHWQSDSSTSSWIITSGLMVFEVKNMCAAVSWDDTKLVRIYGSDAIIVER